jgi:hypothetical protein
MFCPCPNSDRKRPKIASLSGHADARHVLDVMGAWPPCRAAAPHLPAPCQRASQRLCSPHNGWPASLTRLSSPPRSFLLSASALAHAERGAAMDGRPSSLPPVPSPLQAPTTAATCTTAFTSSCCTSRARLPKSKAAGALRPGEPPPVSRCSAWPRLLGPPRGEPRPPTSSRRPPGASPPLPGRRRGLLRRNSELPTTPLLKSRLGTSRRNSTKSRGFSALS